MGLSIVETLRREIAKHDTATNRVNHQQFFKEALDRPVGLKTAMLRTISNQCYRSLPDKSAPAVFALCEELLASDESYKTFFVFEWALKVRRQYRGTDITRFERWLKKHVSNWAHCDHLCCGAIGYLVLMYPATTARTLGWTRSKNRWMKRAAAVSLIVSARKGNLLKEVFQTADRLLTDPDDLVQKGYGWMLKEATKKHPDEVLRYVIRHKATMPRTALRYAIEKLPADMRRRAIAK